MLVDIYLFGFVISYMFYFYHMFKNRINDYTTSYYTSFFNFYPLKAVLIDLFIILILTLLWPIILFFVAILYFVEDVHLKLFSVFFVLFILASIFTTTDLNFNSDKIFNTYSCVEKQYKWINYNLFENIYVKSKLNKLDSLLVCALINAESSGHKYALSSSKARGYMQIMSFHHKGNPKDLYNTNLNLKLGCGYLRFCRVRSPNLEETLRKYNQGHNSKRYKYRNWKYVNKILNHYTAMSERLTEYEESRLQM